MCICSQFRTLGKSITRAFKQTINKNGNKIFRKKIFQLLLIISIKQVIKYIYKDVYYVCPLSISIKTIINKNGNKIFRKKYSNFH